MTGIINLSLVGLVLWISPSKWQVYFLAPLNFESIHPKSSSFPASIDQQYQMSFKSFVQLMVVCAVDNGHVPLPIGSMKVTMKSKGTLAFPRPGFFRFQLLAF
jgi:hypothetical protein